MWFIIWSPSSDTEEGVNCLNLLHAFLLQDTVTVSVTGFWNYSIIKGFAIPNDGTQCMNDDVGVTLPVLAPLMLL